MKSRKTFFFFLGLIVHVIFLLSIFDIYFKSPIVADVEPQKNDIDTPVKRVVVISADGLRFDSLFDKDPDSGEDVAPFIQRIIKQKGSWGVSQSHVPTESRPGHVAMLAGFYEDPSAVTKGWKENPVDFDSIFNQSACSFAWGSPEIVNIFFKGLTHDCAYSETYENEQNFAGNTMDYDNWVYDKMINFFQNSNGNKNLFKKSVFFFAHLLGQDTSGHTDKPHSVKYRENLRNVDNITEGIDNLFNDYYKDSATAFIFTSDHGMTDWGSHGSGDPSEIKTPFVAWGAGIKKLTSPYGINIDQADIVPLLAVLLGVPIPVNSVGVLPASYLNMTDKNIANAMLLNAKQMTAQLKRKMELVKESSFTWLYSPFGKMSNGELDLMIKSISLHIANNQIAEALQKSKILIDISMEGLEYYQNYHQKSLLLFVSLSYIGWISYLILELYDICVKPISMRDSFLFQIFASSVILTILIIFVQKLPAMFYLYYLLPQLLWFLVMQKIKFIQLPVLQNLKKLKYLAFIGVVLLGVEILVAGFFVRWILSLSVGIILVWSFSSINISKSNRVISYLWMISGIILLIFPFIPISKSQPNVFLIYSSGIALVIFSILAVYWYLHKGCIIFSIFRCILIAVSVWNSTHIHSHFNIHNELPIFNQYASWFLWFLSMISLGFGSDAVLPRLLEIFMAFTVPFLFLSTNHESFFLLTLFVNLFCWIHIEYFINISHKNLTDGSIFPAEKRSQGITSADFRIAYFFLSYIWIAFFGIGNIASLNSFDPAWVRCFVTTFLPFLMSFLILFKSIIPFLAVTCTMRALAISLDIKANKLFIIVLIYCSIMGLNFLYFIKNKGSWLDIGTSISHYVIQQVSIVFLVLLYVSAKYLMSYFIRYSKAASEREQLFFLPSFNAKSHAS